MSTGLLDLQQRFRELGRLRMGMIDRSGSKPRPKKLSTWRLTSHSLKLLEAAAQVFGGEVKPWTEAPVEGENYELITQVATLPILVPPGHVLNQTYELWSGGGCRRRCMGPNEEGTAVQLDRDVKCACPLDIGERMELAQQGKACKPTTRLMVILPDVPDIGVWRLESHGYNAATELAGTYAICRKATEAGVPIAARLTIEKRSVKKENKPRQDFTVPIIEIDERIGDVIDAFAEAALPSVQRKALAAGRPAIPSDEPGGMKVPGQEQESRFAEPVPVPDADVIEAEVVTDESETDLPDWIIELPGDDGLICDVAMEVSAEKGRVQEITSLTDLASRDVKPSSQREIKKRLEARMKGQLV